MRYEAHVFWFALTATLVVSPLALRAIAEDPIIGPNQGAIAFSSMDLRGIGLTATVQMTEQRSPGYVPVRLVITGIGAAPVDKRLMFRFATQPRGESPPGNGLIINVPVTIEQGTRRTTVTRYLPKWSVGHCLDVSIYEEGRLLEDSRIQLGKPVTMSPVPIQPGQWIAKRVNLPIGEFKREHELNWLFISQEDRAPSETMPDLNRIMLNGNDMRRDDMRSDDGSIQSNEGTLRDRNKSPLVHIGQATLPSDWRGYQSYDVVVISSEGLSRLAKNQNAMQPLRQWILQGGTAVVYNAESLQEVLTEWRFRCLTRSGETASIRSSIDDRESTQSDAIDQLRQSPMKRIKRVEAQPAGAGLIVSMYNSSKDAGDGQNIPPFTDWRTVTHLIHARSSPMVRNGIEPLLGNLRFRRWMIPGVLQPPVYSFICLLTAFVILVGPIAYLQTSKHGRSHLMFAIAPILAIITTLAMFGYGIVADGLGTRVRVRQLTWVDGQSGDAGERIRATYFAGIRPSDGLRFVGNGEVMRQAVESEMSWDELNGLPPTTLGMVTVGEHAQLFDSSFLPSREQRQFIVHAPRSAIGSVELLPGQSAQSSPKLTSKLLFQLRNLIVRDGEGQYWRVGELNPGETKECESLNSKEASKGLGKLYNDYRPITETMAGRKKKRNRHPEVEPLSFIRIQMGINHRLTAGLFETWLRRHLQTIGELPRLNFVATADVSDDALAIEDAELVDSVRYLFGTVR